MRPLITPLATSGGVAVVAIAESSMGRAMAGAVAMVALVVGAVCWVVADDRRAVRLAVLIQAVRGHRNGRRTADGRRRR